MAPIVQTSPRAVHSGVSGGCHVTVPRRPLMSSKSASVRAVAMPYGLVSGHSMRICSLSSAWGSHKVGQDNFRVGRGVLSDNFFSRNKRMVRIDKKLFMCAS